METGYEATASVSKDFLRNVFTVAVNKKFLFCFIIQLHSITVFKFTPYHLRSLAVLRSVSVQQLVVFRLASIVHVGRCVSLFACVSVPRLCPCRCSILALLKLLEVYRSS